jgi:hypothetical protein
MPGLHKISLTSEVKDKSTHSVKLGLKPMDPTATGDHYGRVPATPFFESVSS